MKRETLPLQALPAWAKLNGISLDGVTLDHLKSDHLDKGAAVVATSGRSVDETESSEDHGTILISVPSDMILSFEGVVDYYAKSDRHLKDVLDAVGSLGRVR